MAATKVYFSPEIKMHSTQTSKFKFPRDISEDESIDDETYDSVLSESSLKDSKSDIEIIYPSKTSRPKRKKFKSFKKPFKMYDRDRIKEDKSKF